MDVRAAIRRTRLRFAASLLLAALLGAPAAMQPAPVTGTSATGTAVVSAAAGAGTVVAAVSDRPAPDGAESMPLLAARAAVPAAPPALTDQARRAPSAPRGPPAR